MLLDFACSTHNEARLSELLNAGFHPDVCHTMTDSEYQDPLLQKQRPACYSVLSKHIQTLPLSMVELLCRHGAHPFAFNPHGQSATYSLLNDVDAWSLKGKAQVMMKKLQILLKHKQHPVDLNAELPIRPMRSVDPSRWNSSFNDNSWAIRDAPKTILALCISLSSQLSKEDYAVGFIHDLLKSGAHPDETYSMSPPLSFAIKNKQLKVVSLLLQFGANPNPPKKAGGSYFLNSALQEAINAGPDFENLLRTCMERDALDLHLKQQKPLNRSPQSLDDPASTSPGDPTDESTSSEAKHDLDFPSPSPVDFRGLGRKRKSL